VLLEKVYYFLRRCTLYGIWRTHGKGGHIPLFVFFLRRGTLELSAHLHLEGGTLERRALQQEKRKGKERVKATSKGKVKEKAQRKRSKD
jgi:hypothetical protein